nr:MAG TPA: hypothetical protein [Caudoviricetes sp.]
MRNIIYIFIGSLLSNLLSFWIVALIISKKKFRLSVKEITKI